MSALRSSLFVLALLPPEVDVPTRARPTIAFHRWSEDWSVLANPKVPREPLDELKYISLSAGWGGRYVGVYGQVRADYAPTSHIAPAVELVH